MDAERIGPTIFAALLAVTLINVFLRGYFTKKQLVWLNLLAWLFFGVLYVIG